MRSKRWFVLALFFNTISYIASGAFYPNDPFFYPGTSYGASEGYFGQWHLHNQMPVNANNVGLDVNILGAWAMGYTGAGVIIAIVDDGVQGNHPDLQVNFQNQYSWDFDKNQIDNLADSYRGSPSDPFDNHGTSVAGVAAARGGNGIGVSGAAPNAGIASLRWLDTVDPDGRTDDDTWMAAILFQGQTDIHGNLDPFAAVSWEHVPVRIKNHSTGALYAYDHGDPDTSIQAVLDSLNHGVMHVFSAGNNRIPFNETWYVSDSGKASYPSIPGTIVTAAMGSDGKFSTYSNYGSNIFVTAPSSSGALFRISSTDRTGHEGYNDFEDGGDSYLHFENGYPYTSTFGGTSSTAPLVSGILALGVEANPNLNARMAQHILVRTSRIVNPDDDNPHGGWITNAAGNSFNRNYGFGLIDATAFVEMALMSHQVTEQTIHDSLILPVNQSFTDTPSLIFSYYASIAPELLQPVEYISVSLLITGLQTDWYAYSVDGIGSIQGDFSAWLTSPSGTRQLLFSDDTDMTGIWADQRSYDSNSLEWTFLSYAYWGENPFGEWILELVNGTTNPLSGTWENVGFVIGMGDLILIPEPHAFVFFLAAILLGVRLVRVFSNGGGGGSRTRVL